MRRFLAILRAARLYARYFPYIEEAEDGEYWNEDDARALNYFFRSVAGRKLQNRLRNYAIQSAMASVMQSNQFQRDVAAGIQMTIAAIENHLPGGVPTDADTELEERQAALEQLEQPA